VFLLAGAFNWVAAFCNGDAGRLTCGLEASIPADRGLKRPLPQASLKTERGLGFLSL